MAIPDPWRRNIDAGLALIDDLELQIARLTAQPERMGADHRQVPLLVTAPGFGWINAFTVASEIGDIARFASPAKLCGYTGLCPRVRQSGAADRRGPLSKHGAKYLRWALLEGRAERLRAPARQGALPAHQAPPGSPARPQGRPDRAGQKAHRGGLAHAHQKRTVRSGRCPCLVTRVVSRQARAVWWRSPSASSPRIGPRARRSVWRSC
jgi:transposase